VATTIRDNQLGRALPSGENVAIDEIRHLCHLDGPHRSFPSKKLSVDRSGSFRIPLPSPQAFDGTRQRSIGHEKASVLLKLLVEAVLQSFPAGGPGRVISR